MSVVRAAYGPSLPELLGAHRWRIVRVAAIAVVIVIAAVALIRREASPEKAVVERGTPTFSYSYQPPLQRFGRAGVQERRGDVFVQSFDVLPLTLPAYRGDPGGTLPVMADALAAQIAARRPGFRIVDEGRARVDDNVGYFVAWQGRLGSRALFGREYLLVPGDQPAPRVGVRLELLSTYAAGVAGADDVGRTGKLKQALRSFTFGTEPR